MAAEALYLVRFSLSIVGCVAVVTWDNEINQRIRWTLL